MIVHMVPGSNTKPSEENIGMFEAAVMVAVVDVLCNSLMLEEHNIYLHGTWFENQAKIKIFQN